MNGYVKCAARLVDEVLPRVSVCRWVLSLPYRLRYHANVAVPAADGPRLEQLCRLC